MYNFQLWFIIGFLCGIIFTLSIIKRINRFDNKKLKKIIRKLKGGRNGKN